MTKIKQQNDNHSCTHATLTLVAQKTISFANHPGESDSECPQYRRFIKRKIFRLDLKEERLGALRKVLGREVQVSGKSMLSLLLEFDAWNQIGSASPERRKREAGQRDQTSR